MKILILGGTGAMGLHLIEILSNESNEVFVTSRAKRVSTDRIKYIQGNAHELSFLSILLKDYWDAIVDFMSYKTEEFNERVGMMLKATSQYIFLSSARVYANSILPITENSPRLLDVSNDTTYLKTDEYALAKARQENLLEGSNRNNWTIVRPYITYSHNRLQLGVWEKENWLYRALNERTIVFSEDIAQRWTTLTYGYDVAKGIAVLVGNNKALGEKFHIATEESIQWGNVLKIYMEVIESKMGYRPRVKVVDKSSNLRWRNAQYQVLYDRYYDRRFDNSKILSIAPQLKFHETEKGLRSSLERFIEKPIFLPIGLGTEALLDKETGEHIPLNRIPSQRAKYILFRYTPLLQIIENLKIR